ncbi:hypothetical protein FQA39_LY05599 [Lamprigera yunnana]|nr:hypothetical protein FQA39_LY05599 [Lamprigera yunnana]
MGARIVVCLLTFLTIAELKSPQVYEEVEEAPAKNTTEDTNQMFDIAASKQQDRQKWRYLQQQVFDMRNQARNTTKSPRKRDLHNVKRSFRTPLSINHGLALFDNTKSLEDSANSQIDVLNSLIGQSPVAQLRGLKILLNSKDHTPVMEDVFDVDNPLNRPNVKVEPAPPELQQAVANVLVLQADTQRKIKEHNEIALSEYEKHLKAYQAQSQNIPQIQLGEVHPTYGQVIGAQNKPIQNANNVYNEHNDNVSIFFPYNLQRTKRDADLTNGSLEDWYLDYDYDNITNLNTTTLSDNYEYYYEIYNNTEEDVQNFIKEVGSNRRHYELVHPQNFDNPPKHKYSSDRDSKPQTYIVINNNNNADHGHKHKSHRPQIKPRRKRKFKKRPKFGKRPFRKSYSKRKTTKNKIKYILRKLDALHI